MYNHYSRPHCDLHAFLHFCTGGKAVQAKVFHGTAREFAARSNYYVRAKSLYIKYHFEYCFNVLVVPVVFFSAFFRVYWLILKTHAKVGARRVFVEDHRFN